MGRACNTNALVGHHIGGRFCVASEAMSRVGAQIHFMMTIVDAKRLRELARSRAKTFHVVNATKFLHSFDPSPRLQGANQDETVLSTFHQHVQHPMHSIIEIDISCARVVSLDKAAGARPSKRMRGLVVDCRIRFHLDDNPRAIVPN